MTGLFASVPYEGFSCDLDAAIEWVTSLGVTCDSTRIGEYKRAINTLLELTRSKDSERIKREFEGIVTALFEANDFIAIHKGLSGRYDEEIRDHITKYVKGPANYRNEAIQAGSNLPRNTAFELLVASRLASANIELNFSIKTDIAAKFDNRVILFECKRPQSSRKLKRNINNAFKQLERTYKSSIRFWRRGIIALDITKLLNPDFMLYVQPNAAAIHNGLANIVDLFIENNTALWQVQRNSKTIAVLIRVGVMAIDRERNDMLVYCQQFGLTPINTSGSRNITTARRLAEALDSAS